MTLLGTAGEEGGRKVTAADIKAACRARFVPPEWFMAEEVTLGRRRLDVLAFNCFGARGYRTVGVEVKVSRGDFRAEVRHWDKADEWATVVDQFYIAAPKGVVLKDEVPVGWGLLEYVNGRLISRVRPRTEVTGTLPREVTARLLKRATDRAEAAERQARDGKWRVTAGERAEIRAEVEAQWAQRAQDESAVWRRKAAAYDALLVELGSSGWWTRQHVREAVQLLRETDGLNRLSHMQADLARAAQSVRQAQEAMQKWEEWVAQARAPVQKDLDL